MAFLPELIHKNEFCWYEFDYFRLIQWCYMMFFFPFFKLPLFWVNAHTTILDCRCSDWPIKSQKHISSRSCSLFLAHWMFADSHPSTKCTKLEHPHDSQYSMWCVYRKSLFNSLNKVLVKNNFNLVHTDCPWEYWCQKMNSQRCVMSLS